MTMTVRGKIIRIGNSRGVRLPKQLLEESGLTGEVEMEAKDGIIVISPSNRVRETWDIAFSKMAAASDDALLDANESASE